MKIFPIWVMHCRSQENIGLDSKKPPEYLNFRRFWFLFQKDLYYPGVAVLQAAIKALQALPTLSTLGTLSTPDFKYS